MDTFPLEGQALPLDAAGKPKAGFLIFFDEFNSAPLAVQAASYKVILDRKIGQHALHPKSFIVAAGNLASNKAIVNRMSTAMQSRMIHMQLTTEPNLWAVWAAQNKLDHRVIAYIESKPDNLHNFKPDHDDSTFACPRTWEFVSKLVLGEDTKDLHQIMPLLAGTVGQGAAREFVTYTKIYSKMPKFADILRNPAGAKLDEEPSMMYGAAHMVAAYATDKNIDKLMIYISRMPIEFETITLQTIMRRDQLMISTPAVKQWITTKGAELF